jgi:hypothetical protein
MTTPTDVASNDLAAETTSAAAAATSGDSADHERLSSRRKAVLVTSLVALIAAVGCVWIAFPGMLGAAIVIAVAAAIVVLDLLFPPREVRQPPESFWIL